MVRGLRAAEVAALKGRDIDSERMLLRVERGKGGRYRNAMLPVGLLALLREWWRVGRRERTVFVERRDHCVGIPVDHPPRRGDLGIAARPITCEQVDTDRYRRSVATCRVGGEDIGAAVVEAGWATAYRRYSMAYVGQEARAREARRGIWALGFEPPADYRRERRLADVPQAPDPRCPIKGNVGASGARIYHMPGGRAYPEVRIDARKGERWFCSEREAVAAGWRPIR